MLMLVPLTVSPTRGPPSDRPKLVQAHANRYILQAPPYELSPDDIRYL
jgi:hypothetical protein